MLLNQLQKTKNFIRKKVKANPKIAVILGSGLGNIENTLKNSISIPYGKIPHFKQSTVEGHNGQLIFGKLNSVDIMLMSGRLHYYEGYAPQDIIYPVRVMKTLGIENIIITAAAGAVNKKYSVGDLVFVKDHINFTGNNPLIGTNIDKSWERFPSMAQVYDETLRKKAYRTAKKLKIPCRQGVYFGVSGPSYETPAEIKAFGLLGADVVGMSVVYEAIAAAHMKMKVLAIAYVSNMAAGTQKKVVEAGHGDVLKTGEKTATNISAVIKEVLEVI